MKGEVGRVERMEVATKYRSAKQLADILQGHLGISMEKGWKHEVGTFYSWHLPPNENGISYQGIFVWPARFNGFRFSVQVSPELSSYTAQIRALMRKGVLEGVEVLP